MYISGRERRKGETNGGREKGRDVEGRKTCS